MFRTIPVVDKTVRTTPFEPVVIAAGATVDVLPDASKTKGEYVARLIQNAGANVCYYAFGRTASAVDYNGFLNPGNQADCTIERISVYSLAGTTIAITQLMRQDMTTHAEIFNQGP